MADVRDAYQAYKQADQDALAMRFRARARLGRTIACERKSKGQTQDDVAGRLGVVVQQVRRYEAAWRAWAKEHPGEELD